jgi:hypothetical protein
VPATWHYAPYWWGYTYYYDHCAIADIQLKLTIAGGVATVIAALAGGVPAIVVGAMAAWWQVDSQWMAPADSHCNNVGADLSATWTAPGVFWVKPMC